MSVASISSSSSPDTLDLRSASVGIGQFDQDEQREIAALKRRDAEVCMHEQAHTAAAGSYAKGGASYDYVTGPDGKRYATGGEVHIDTSAIPDNPEATIAKARTIAAAALAPAKPSAQDRRVAAQAVKMEQNARMELARMKSESYDQNGQSPDKESSSSIFDLLI